MKTYRYDAIQRVDTDPRLQPYRNLLISYDWPEGEEHYEWVATALIAELLSWCETVG